MIAALRILLALVVALALIRVLRLAAGRSNTQVHRVNHRR